MCFNRSLIMIVILVFALLIGCSREENKIPKSTPAKEVNEVKSKAGDGVEISRIFVATKYSGGVWENGINKKNRNRFFISIARTALMPIKTGAKLKLAWAGEAVVTQVGRQDYQDYSSIFVTVNKNLDPVKDGNPNPIYIKSIDLQPCPYSEAGEWQNGIHLVKPGFFFITIERMDQTPIKVGDRVKFAKSGQATVTEISRKDRQDNFSNIFVKVDKSLDGVADGCPNMITVMITD